MALETPTHRFRALQPARESATRKVVVFKPPRAEVLGDFRTLVVATSVKRDEFDARALSVIDRIESAARASSLGVCEGTNRATGECAGIVVETLPRVALRAGATPLRAVAELPVRSTEDLDWEGCKAMLGRLGRLAQFGDLDLVVHAPKPGCGEGNLAFAGMISQAVKGVEISYLARLLVFEEEVSQWDL